MDVRGRPSAPSLHGWIYGVSRQALPGLAPDLSLNYVPLILGGRGIQFRHQDFPSGFDMLAHCQHRRG